MPTSDHLSTSLIVYAIPWYLARSITCLPSPLIDIIRVSCQDLMKCIVSNFLFLQQFLPYVLLMAFRKCNKICLSFFYLVLELKPSMKGTLYI